MAYTASTPEERSRAPTEATVDKQKTKKVFSLSSLDLSPARGYLRLLSLASKDSVLDFALIFIGFFAAVGAGIPYPLLGILFGKLVDDLNSTSCSSTSTSTDDGSLQAAVNQKLLLVIYVTIANFCLIWLHCGCWSLFGERLVRKLRHRYLKALLRQDITYFETLPAGVIATRLDADLTTVQAGTSEKVGIVIQSVSYFVAAYVVAFLKDAKLAGILVSLVPCFLIMALGGNHFIKRYAGRVSEGTAKATAIASEALANMRLIKVFGAAARIENIYVGYLRDTHRAAIGKFLTASVQMGLLYFIAYCASAVAMWQGGLHIAESVAMGDGHGITVGNVYTVIFVLVDASFIISLVAPFLTIFANASKSSEELLRTIQRQAPIQGRDQEQGVKQSSILGDISFENVSFSYPSRPEVPVLENVSLSIPSNKMTGVVGSSGSGKSTIAALVERFYDPDSGKVTVDGTDLRDLNLHSYRGHVSIVEQMPKLFNRSVLENIAHGLVGSARPEHQELQEALVGGALAQLTEDVRRGGNLDTLALKDPALKTIVRLVRDAAELVGATEYIDRLQHGLATTVGPGGGMLSGGQKQRAAFARAVIRDPSILILDEATAALDSASEAWIQHAMDKFTANRTTIVIAHRLSTIKNADNVLVIERGGKVTEQGTYADLMARDGVFASLVRLQSLKSDEDDDIHPRGSGETTTSDSIKTNQNLTKDGRESFDNIEKSNEGQDSDSRNNTHALEHTSTTSGTRGFLSTFGAILGLARPQLVFIIIGVTAATIVGGSHSGEAVIFGNVVGRLNSCRLPSEIRESASLFGGLFFGLALVEFLANAISTASFGWVSEKLLFKTRVLSLRSLLEKSLHWHESEGRTPGTLVAYISADAVAMSGMTGAILGVTFSVVVSLIAGIVLAHVIAWKIALVLLACVPVLFMSGFLRIRVQAQFAARHAKAFAESVAIAIEAVDSIRIISAFSLQRDVANSFLRSLRGPYTSTLNSILYGNFWLALSFSVGNCVYALAYWWGAKQTAQGTYSQTQFFIVLMSLLVAAQSSGQIVSLAPDISKAAVASRRVLSLIVPRGEKASRVEKEARRIEGPGDPEQADDKTIAGSQGTHVDDKTLRNGVTVALRNVNFAYPSRPDVPVLSDLSLHIPGGSFAALVGHSGAGKSTVVSLLERLYVPASGSITLDGLDITTAPEDTTTFSFRDETALVPQDTVLFSGTVAFNIGLGARPGSVATQAEIETAARLACIHDTIASLPQGYDTPCGPSAGLSLFSGGQKQRLCIARALVRRPRLLLLDESSSSLDAEGEAAWEAALETVCARGGVTVVAVAHRLRTIMKADVIFVMENGRVLDCGSHEELVARCERYRNDVLLQTLE